ncbi:MAG: RMD1 family protein [bacterium]|nr:RMD1 family protein [bacterium]
MAENNLNLKDTDINRQISFSSYHVVKELKLKDLVKKFDERPLVFTPLVLGYQFGSTSYCFIYNFGSVVFFNLSTTQQTAIINAIQNHLDKIFDLSVMDEYFLELKPREKNKVTFNRVIVDSIDSDKVELISLVLAQSTALEFFEQKVDGLLEKVKKMTATVGLKSKSISERSILKLIKEILAIRQDIIVSLRLLEKPEAAWEKKVLDVLYEEGITMFELKERFMFLKEKLQMIQGNLEVLSNFSSTRKMIVLEVAIVGLFILDVLLVSYELFIKT